MKKIRWYVLLTILILASTLTHAGTAPTTVQDSLKNLYPKINLNDVAWSQDQGYYLANFQSNSYNVKAYFNNNGQCMMVETDLVTLDDVPSAVYNSFTMSSFAADQIRDVTMVDFPKWQPIYVILVGEANLEGSVQLFYSPYGQLLRQRSTVGLDDILGPSTFL